MLGLLFGAEPHYPLDAGAVVPTAVEDYDFSSRGKMWNVALGVHLRFLSLCRCGKRNHPEHTRAHPLGHCFYRATLTGTVAAFEDNACPQAFVHHPFLKPDKLNVQPLELLLISLPLEFADGIMMVVLVV